ncbi:MAG TPA: transglycosylase SLT domain-containing protein, partial [Thermoanaerobaculia bacterium]|nr:transglycosylase SLT domain-containing protein [Thermoanaerobaculia bacterium]
PAAARGLMQLTLPTAGEAARELSEEPPAYMQLYEPARSLRLGAHTLAGLLARFRGDPVPAVSGYNAGAGQTTLWVGAAQSAPEALLAAVTYAETRTYLRRVLAHRALYRLAEPGGGERR